jgi:hypothetical protein
MRSGWAAAAVAALWAAAPAGAADRYKPQELFDRKGYSEKRLGEGLWRVKTTVEDMSSTENAQRMALYRGAELARQAGYDYFQVLSGKGWMGYSTQGKKMNVHAHGAELKVRGTRDYRDQAPCEMKGGTCPVFGTDHVLARLGPLFAGQPAPALGLPPLSQKPHSAAGREAGRDSGGGCAAHTARLQRFARRSPGIASKPTDGAALC